ncbi:Tetratricopeptide repeat (TPR)-like superfamily protein [Arabidopsis thaliana]|uniref:Tetratricopeptide repeat (TPR)-like superfamily protein n=1 Tax=Arabidopsis thaliana TaxID=3702 RepID=F4IBX4_ARATH|nr:Tetratricopeptide repeat (TPR)-like superfamily protein [Arabidopsis thaliana]AEE36175.1 Tetratricopeptide repeat (TPR)-like superfamily protein [Arabidopsis thaliana]|eukprot:NP_001185430.1 Tetratricopeptide repeat (TPR)-like superfamily protein [Arabidopsis thaliana]
MLMTLAATTSVSFNSKLLLFRIRCSDSNPKRGFGSKKEEKDPALQQRKSSSKQSVSVPRKAPGLNTQFEGKSGRSFDIDFDERLENIRRSALEQKKTEVVKEFGPIDYDAPVKSDQKTIGLGTKVGVGIAVVVFGLVFALGDFLPTGRISWVGFRNFTFLSYQVIDSPTKNTTVVKNQISEEEKATLQQRLKEFETTLNGTPQDQAALEGAAVTLTELGDYSRAAAFLEKLAKERPTDPDVFRLLGEVNYELNNYEGSIAAYKISEKVSKGIDLEVTRGLMNAYLAAKKPDEAVKFLLDTRERLNTKKTSTTDSVTDETNLDPIQVELLLGKAYSDWGHISDAIAVYDQLISAHPEDFRGYLAKGIILRENGSRGDAERMFIQARFFAPNKAKALVDRYSKL